MSLPEAMQRGGLCGNDPKVLAENFEAYLAWRQQTQGGPAGGAGGAVGPTTATPWAPTKFIAAPGVQTAAGTPTKAHETPKSAKVQKRGANVDFKVCVKAKLPRNDDMVGKIVQYGKMKDRKTPTYVVCKLDHIKAIDNTNKKELASYVVAEFPERFRDEKHAIQKLGSIITTHNNRVRVSLANSKFQTEMSWNFGALDPFFTP